ncbi:MAG: ABC transporter transmembrane domain-containing protein [Alphaproteobacteria bacterium]|nr:ABC transporter transmembrane domain-containing protein [Alphaproteobacteria bacterium]
MKLLSWREILKLLNPPFWPIFFGFCAILIASVTFLAFGLGVKFLIDKGFVSQNPEILNQGLLYLGIIIFVLSCSSYVRYYCLNWASENALLKLKDRFFQHNIHQDRYFYQKESLGSLVTHFSQDLTFVQTTLSQTMPVMVRNILLFIGGVFLLFWTNFELASIALLLIPIILLPSLWIAKKIKVFSQKIQMDQQDQTQFLMEVFGQIPFIQASAKENYFHQYYKQKLNAFKDIIQKRLRLRSALIMIVFTLVFGGIGFVLWYGGHQVFSHDISAGDLSSFIFYAIIAASSLSVISESHQEFSQMKLMLTKIAALLDYKSEIFSPLNPLFFKNETPELIFDAINFAYPGMDQGQKALQDIHLKIKKGHKIGLVGASGSGKSTLFRLLLRLYDPINGQILWNGIPLNQFDLKELRSKIAYIPQEPVIFSTTIRENLTLGEKIETDRLIEAAKLGQCYDFIQKLPQGFETFIAASKGGIGIELSGGEKQRLALTRAFLQNPLLILLDEVTNALDNQNDALIQKALHFLMQDRTSIVIAHKLSTIEQLDWIFVLDQGKLVEEGTHLDLLSKDGFYAKQYYALI